MNADRSPTTARETLEAIAAKTVRIGSYYYFDPATKIAGQRLGLGPYEFYLLGRGGALGDVSAAVVASAFGYFNADGVAKTWNENRTIVSPPAAAEAYFDECGKRGSELLGELACLDAYIEAADVVIDRADLAALPLFAGYAQLRCCEDSAGRAMQKAAVLRELRGGVHLCAVLASGLSPAQAHAMKNPGLVQAFGWTEVPDFPTDVSARMAAAERLTNLLLEQPFSVLTEQEAAALVAGTNAIDATLPEAARLSD